MAGDRGARSRALRLNVARTGEGRYDIDDLIARFAPKPDAEPRSEPAHFALCNLRLNDAELRFDDQPVKRLHVIDALNLALPFISNLPAQVEVKVEPRLAFALNGTAFDSGARATPFARTRSRYLKLAFTQLDLAPYLGYLPASLPVRVTKDSLSADLDITFAMPPSAAPSVAMKGRLSANGLTFTDAAGVPLLDWQSLQLGLRDVQPLARKLAFDTLRIDGLRLQATRDAAGRINLLQLAAAPVEANAITAPFSLLAGGGGGDDLSVVKFKPGTAQIVATGVGAIDKVAKALAERPALKMTVTGAADLATEREAFQSAALDARLVAKQRRDALRAGAPASAASTPVTLRLDERARPLKQLYTDTELPNKPRNPIGFAQDIPGPDMEPLLKARAPVTEEAVRALALARGIAVRDAPLAKGLTTERLFLAAPKLRVSREDNGAWTPRLQLSLSVN